MLLAAAASLRSMVAFESLKSVVLWLVTGGDLPLAVLGAGFELEELRESGGWSLAIGTFKPERAGGRLSVLVAVGPAVVLTGAMRQKACVPSLKR